MTPVVIRALGPLEAVVAGHPADLGTPKQRALLALLTSRAGRPVNGDVLREALWEGSPPAAATTSLHAYVANLRKVLEPDRAPRTPATVLRTCPGGYLLDGHMADIDVRRFDNHASAGWRAWDRDDPHRALSEFEAALALWRGPAFPDVTGTLVVSPEVGRLDELRLSIHEVRCAALLTVGAHEVAVSELEAFTQSHPLREYGCELLSLALYRAGRQAEALEVLRTTQARLAEELGIDPRPALRTLEQNILTQSSALDRQAPPAPAPAMSTPTPAARVSAPAEDDVFIGREAELHRLTDALAAASERGRVVALSGEAGIGKTCLLRRFVEQAHVPVLWGTCPEHVDAPSLWPWEQVVRALAEARPPGPGPVSELLNGSAEPSAGGDTLRRFEAIVGYLTEASHAAPLVVVLDHLHRADPSSLRLLAHLTESVSTSRILLAVSYRSDEAGPLVETLAALARAGVSRIELGGLSVQETGTLARATLGDGIGADVTDVLWDRTAGNPFFVRELVKVLASCRSTDPRTVPVPAPARDMVLGRVARLPRAAADLLVVAAVAGRVFDIEVVAEAALLDVDAALDVIDTAVAAGLVSENRQRLGWFDFTHALAAEALYETTGRLRRERVRLRIGAAAAGRIDGGAGRYGVSVVRPLHEAARDEAPDRSNAV